jgi:lysophospholipase L1-like esterase
MKKFAKPLVAIVTSLVCILFAELAFRIFSPVPDPYAEFKYRKPEVNQYIKSEFSPNLQLITEPEEGLPGLKGPNHFTTNNLGFRGDYLTVPKPANEYRIFMVGGSTTECLYLDDRNAINRVVQNELNQQAAGKLSVKVYGAGKSGDASDDHCSMVIHRIAQLEPDVIVLFAGINDLTRSIGNYDYLHFVAEIPPTKIPLLRSLASESQIARRFFYLWTNTSPSTRQVFQEIHLRSQYKEAARLCASLPVTDQQPRLDLTAYANNLKSIVAVARAHGAQVVLMTQQTTWNDPANPHLKDWQWTICRSGQRYREDLMMKALEALNDQMRQVAREYSLPLYDLARTMPKSREFFYDDVHFNDEGARVAGLQLATLIHPTKGSSEQAKTK